MEKGTFDFQKGRGAGFHYKGKTIFSEGHHRMNAAIKYYLNTGNDIYIRAVLNSPEFINVLEYSTEIYPFRTLKK